MERTYQILTDSTADLDAATLAAPGLTVIPMPITLDGTSFHHYGDYRELSSADFYAALRAGKEVQTAQINILAYLRAFLRELRAGRDVIYLCFTSGLSGTIQSAQMVIAVLREKYPQRKILCIDSLCASIGQGFFVRGAVEQQSAGLSFDQLSDWAEGHKRLVAHWFTVEDLHHLHRGGRLSKTAAVAGTMLQVKPILTLDAEGKLTIAGKVRGTQKAYRTMVDTMRDTAAELSGQTLYIGHGDNPQGAQKLEDMIRAEFAVGEIFTVPIGPVIGAHTGPGMVALVYWKRA
ncbi:MAG: DegV family protein [Oscillospiraceae bacterium]